MKCISFNCDECLNIDFANLVASHSRTNTVKTSSSAVSAIKSTPVTSRNSINSYNATASSSTGRITRTNPNGLRKVPSVKPQSTKNATAVKKNVTADATPAVQDEVNIVESDDDTGSPKPINAAVKPTKSIIGTDLDCVVTAAKSLSEIGIYNVEKSVTSEVIISHIASKVPDCQAKCRQIFPKNIDRDNLKYASFIVTVEPNFVAGVLDPSIWGKGIIVRDLKENFRQKKQFRRPPRFDFHRVDKRRTQR